jgi:peptidyl-prolyl cis-trans isomerase C
MPDEQRKVARRQTLAVLIDEALMKQFLTRNTPPVTSDDVDKKLNEMSAELKKQGKTLVDFCRESGQTEARLRASISYAIRWQGYARNQISDVMVQKYYSDCKDFFDGVSVKASHIVLRVPPTASPADQQAAREQLNGLRTDLIAGKIEFAEAAKKYSQCPSAAGGGDVGFFPRKWVVEEPFAKAAFALKVGEISEVVQTDYGLHLIEVTDRKAGQP